MASFVIVSLLAGLVQGTRLPSGVRVFRGMRYATAARWQNPQPVARWDGVRDATEFGPACPQPITASVPTQSEDCLYANVWAPAPAKGAAPLPVMVWIHGGGFSGGSATQCLADGQLLYDGESLAKHGVVVVSFNYRLGPFGFFAHPQLPGGNYGLADQIAALRWVRDNAAAFGGDASQVTIFGESAGGQSVAALMAAPAARGLFQRAISESGFGASGMARDEASWQAIGAQTARELGCVGDGTIACLRAKPVEEWLKTAAKAPSYAPVVDGEILPADPDAIFRGGKQAPVPLLLGLNRNEGALNAKFLGLDTVDKYQGYLAKAFPGHAAELAAVFPAATDADVPAAADRFFTALLMTRLVRGQARAMRAVGAPTYLYHFTRVPPYSQLNGLWGAYHSLELFYVFGALAGRSGFTETDAVLSERMQAFWTAFARTGKPDPVWPEFGSADDEPYLELGDTVSAKAHLSEAECDLLDRLTSRR